MMTLTELVNKSVPLANMLMLMIKHVRIVPQLVMNVKVLQQNNVHLVVITNSSINKMKEILLAVAKVVVLIAMDVNQVVPMDVPHVLVISSFSKLMNKIVLVLVLNVIVLVLVV